MAPIFTLRLADVQVPRFSGTIVSLRWLLESSDPEWSPIHSSEGNINTAAHADWAFRWANEKVAANSPYVVTNWVDNDEPRAQTWAAELKRIRHNFLLTWDNMPPMVLSAKNQEDADLVEFRILEGDNFVRLYNEAGDTVLIGLSQILSITYQPVEVDL